MSVVPTEGSSLVRFNRTFMELKYRTDGRQGSVTTVLIVPLWN